MKPRTTKALSVTLLVATGFLAVGLAAPQGFGRGPGGSVIPPRRVVENLPGITEEQLNEIGLLREEVTTTIGPLREQRREFLQTLRFQMDSEAPDPFTVGELFILGRGVAQEIHAAEQDFRETFQAILTSEQLEALKGFKAGRHLRRRGGGFPSGKF